MGVGEREIVVIGGQHAREWLASAATLDAVEKLLANAELGEAESSSALEQFKITIFPLMNPDGYTFTHQDRMWRKNTEGASSSALALGDSVNAADVDTGCFGVDLNRNWQGGSTFLNIKSLTDPFDQCSTSFHGSRPFSEPETKAIKDYVGQRGSQQLGESGDDELGRVVAFVDIHTYSEDVISPGCNHKQMTANNAALNQKVGQAVADKMNEQHGRSYKFGDCQSMLHYTFGGGAGDWAHFDAKVPVSLSMELRSRKSSMQGGYGFLAPASVIKPTGDEVLAGLTEMAQQIDST